MSQVFVALLPRDAEGVARELSQSTGCRRSNKSPLHMTVVPPFTTDESSLGRIVHVLERASATLGPVLGKGRPCTFPPPADVVVLEISGAAGAAVRCIFAEIVPHIIEPQTGWLGPRPHVTIGWAPVIDPEEATMPHNVWFDRIALFARERAGSPWHPMVEHDFHGSC
jgi:hypothetical protein